jgi:hypothetical protein
MHLAFNEKTKLTATWFNTLSLAFVVVGAVTPFASSGYEGSLTGFWPGSYFLLFPIAWIAGGIALHLIARRILGRLRE